MTAIHAYFARPSAAVVLATLAIGVAAQQPRMPTAPIRQMVVPAFSAPAGSFFTAYVDAASPDDETRARQDQVHGGEEQVEASLRYFRKLPDRELAELAVRAYDGLLSNTLQMQVLRAGAPSEEHFRERIGLVRTTVTLPDGSTQELALSSAPAYHGGVIRMVEAALKEHGEVPPRIDGTFVAAAAGADCSDSLGTVAVSHHAALPQLFEATRDGKLILFGRIGPAGGFLYLSEARFALVTPPLGDRPPRVDIPDRPLELYRSRGPAPDALAFESVSQRRCAITLKPGG